MRARVFEGGRIGQMGQWGALQTCAESEDLALKVSAARAELAQDLCKFLLSKASVQNASRALSKWLFDFMQAACARLASSERTTPPKRGSQGVNISAPSAGHVSDGGGSEASARRSDIQSLPAVFTELLRRVGCARGTSDHLRCLPGGRGERALISTRNASAARCCRQTMLAGTGSKPAS